MSIPGNIRDIALTSSRDAGRTVATPVRLSENKWVLDGCPENGLAMAVGSEGRVHLVWPTLVPGPTPGRDGHVQGPSRSVVQRVP